MDEQRKQDRKQAITIAAAIFAARDLGASAINSSRSGQPAELNGQAFGPIPSPESNWLDSSEDSHMHLEVLPKNLVKGTPATL